MVPGLLVAALPVAVAPGLAVAGAAVSAPSGLQDRGGVVRLASAPGPATVASPASGGLRYVALGDSVPYGHGLANPATSWHDGLPPDQGPSPLAWPAWVDHRVAGLAPMTVRHKGCDLSGHQLSVSGAPTQVNRWTGKDTDCPKGPEGLFTPVHKAVVPNEVDAAGFKADPPALVTIQAGADDIDFAGCLTALLVWPSPVGGDKCVTSDRGRYSLTTRAAAELKSAEHGLRKAISDVLAVAPNAQILLVDYYQIIPAASVKPVGTSAICRDLRDLGPTRRKYIRGAAEYVQSRLNGSIRAAAKGNPNVAVVDIATAFDKHEMCTKQPWLFDGGLWSNWRAAHPTEHGQGVIAKAVVSFCDNLKPTHCLGHLAGGGRWQAVRAPLPADADPSPHVYLPSVACPSPSSCVAAGDYVDTSGQSQGLLLTGSGARWTATRALLPANAASVPSASLQSVVCASTSSCIAVGIYTDTSDRTEGLSLTRSGAHWKPAEVPLPPPDPGGEPDTAFLDSVACASAAMCVAAGTYGEYFPSAGETLGYGLLLTWNGTSWTATKAPVPAAGEAGSARFPQAGQPGAACSPASCLVVGTYANADSPGTPLGLLLTWNGKSWKAAEAPVPAGTDLSNGQVGLFAAACPASSGCVAAGFYQTYTTSAHNYDLVVTGAGRAWKVADAVTAPPLLLSVACPSQASCTASGTALLLTGAGTAWHAVAAPPPANGGSLLASVSCPSAYSCAVAAQSPSGTWGQPDGGLVITGARSTWTSTLVPLPRGFNGSADLNSIACPSLKACIAVGEGNMSGTSQGLLLTGPS